MDYPEQLAILARAQGDPAALALALVDLVFASETQDTRAGLRAALEAAAVPHWVTAESLAVLLELPVREAAERLARLRQLTILESFPARGDGACNVHEQTRLALCRQLAESGRLPAIAARASAGRSRPIGRVRAHFAHTTPPPWWLNGAARSAASSTPQALQRSSVGPKPNAAT